MDRLFCRVGCEFEYECAAPVPAIAQIFVRPDGEHRIVRERSSLAPGTGIEEYRDSFGNRCGRLVLAEGISTLRYDALVEVPAARDIVVADAKQTPVESLPHDAILYVLPSRYCPSDRLLSVAWDLFGETEPGWARVQAVCDWVHSHVTFMHGGVGLADAVEVYLQRRGVCRDFAHLAVALSRALNIPARYGFGYMGDIGIPPMDAAMDFHAWFEVYLDGRWYTFDCRHNTPRIGRIFIGKGRDAVDVAMLTTFGPARLLRMTVWADEVPEETALE
jgi:transglutaminase-like putative cysteine protease